MSSTVIEPTTSQGAVINQDINARVRAIMDQQNNELRERQGVIHGLWVGRVGQLHVAMRGPGGTGKSLLSRSMAAHIKGAQHFETALDETTDPSVVFGPPDIKAMAEDGRTRTVYEGMLPEATDAFLDEFFNGNIPLLHSIMPTLNERVFHNDGKVMKTPLRQCIMGTNKLNLDPDLAALFDRIHIRFDVDYIASRDNLRDMLIMSMNRLASKGRGVATDVDESSAHVTVEELDQAFAEALALNVPDSILELFIDLREELKGNGVVFSDRRFNDGMNAVLANAWIRNHVDVQPVDLDILANMWWTHEEQISTARGIILSASSPGEKKALDLLDALDEIKKEMRQAEGDEERERRQGVECVRNAEKLVKEAEAELEIARDAGGGTSRLEEVISKANAFKVSVAQQIFGLGAADMNATAGV